MFALINEIAVVSSFCLFWASFATLGAVVVIALIPSRQVLPLGRRRVR
ncbi:hypothetical protein [Schlesneria paludicola]|nr:hypothetical protein [Schlesneria paludicola]